MPGKDMTQVTSYDQTGSLPSVLSAKRDKNPRALDSPTRKARRRELTRKLDDLKNCERSKSMCRKREAPPFLLRRLIKQPLRLGATRYFK
jgi:hypothetical protein